MSLVSPNNGSSQQTNSIHLFRIYPVEKKKSKAKLGFCWQFITLAGFHCDALSIDLFAKASGDFHRRCRSFLSWGWCWMCQEYATRGAYAYVSMIQREERKNKVLMPYPKVFQKGREWGGRRGEDLEVFVCAMFFFLACHNDVTSRWRHWPIRSGDLEKPLWGIPKKGRTVQVLLVSLVGIFFGGHIHCKMCIYIYIQT